MYTRSWAVAVGVRSSDVMLRMMKRMERRVVRMGIGRVMGMLLGWVMGNAAWFVKLLSTGGWWV